MTSEPTEQQGQSEEVGELEQRVVSIKRTSKVQKGGRSFQLSAMVAVGDRNGHVGIGQGKAKEVPEAIRKGEEAARKNLITVPLSGTTIPHAVNYQYSGGHVLMKPAGEGTGVIAGETMRAVLELAGVKDILAKSLRSNNPMNVLKATLFGLHSLRVSEEVSRKRGVELAEAPESA